MAKKASKRAGRNPQKKKHVDLAALREFVRSTAVKFLDQPNINSVGIGFKNDTDEIAIQFTVDKKYSPEQLEALEAVPMIPKSFTVGGVEIRTDVVERKYQPVYQVVAESTKGFRKSRQNALTPGISVAHSKSTAGTLGCIVYDAANGTPYILSNWHVLHTKDGNIGDTVVQPGPFDDNNTQANVCGRLVRSHLGLAGDCAIATIEGRTFDEKVYEVDTVPRRAGRAELRDKVMKSGRTTAVTHGVVTRTDVITNINYDGRNERIGGFEIGPDPNLPADDDEISMGGDSGSIWLAKDRNGKPTDVALGLHFAGESPNNPHEYALACYAHSVLEKLAVTLSKPPGIDKTVTGLGAAGYNPRFLAQMVELPRATAAVNRDLVALNGQTVFAYTHFSLALSKSRRYARWVAYNIDGARIVKAGIRRVNWRFDPRIPKEQQVGDELYRDSLIDRGHLAKREDLLWGTPDEAAQANRDSFMFTNASPQHKAFNEGIWKQLEDAIFRETDVLDLRVSVFTGPIYRPDDRVYRNVAIPRDFWKILIWVDEEKGPRASAFLMTQDDLIRQIEAFGLEKFKVYQVSIGEVARRTGLRFGNLDRYDTRPAAGPEALTATAGATATLVESFTDLQL